MNSLAIGLASGLGNAVFMLPAIKALKAQGNRIALFVQGDFAMADLFRRCVYADEVLEPPQSLNGHRPICGQWRPPAWNGVGNVTRVQNPYPYRMPEWESNLRLAGAPKPDISDWCDGVDRTPRWDVGIIPGSKSGIWLRKRYPQMRDIAAFYLAQGKRVAVFGTNADGVNEIPGESVATPTLTLLPDALAGCRVIIGTDSGPTHLASSLGIPVVVVYTATSDVKGQPIGPHRIVKAELNCQPCQTTPRYQGCREWKCREIDIDKVIEAAQQLENQNA